MVQIDFSELGLDLVAGTIIGAIGATVELTAATLASSSMPLLFNNTTIPLYAGIVGLGMFVGAIFGKVGSKMYKASSIN